MENCSPAQIRAALQLFMEGGRTIEMRALGVEKAGTCSGYFNQVDAALEAAIRLSGRAEGVYVTLNPVDPQLLARAANRVKPYARNATGDLEVVERRWLVIDVDPKRPKGISSTDEEHKAAHRTAQRIKVWIKKQTGAMPVHASSGNGAHLLYRCSLPNSPEARDKAKDCLRSISVHFNDEWTDVDVSMFNAARICRLYGTMARKGDATPDRPHRISKIISNPYVVDQQDHPQPAMILLETLDKMIAALSQEQVNRQPPGEVLPPAVPEPPRPRPFVNTTNLNVVEWFVAHDKYGRVLSEESGISTVLCPWEDEHSTEGNAMDSDTIIYNGTDGRPPGFKCLHAHCVHKRLQDVVSLWGDAEQFGAVRHAEGEHDRTDEGNVNRLISRWQERIRYCKELGGWMTWAGNGKWECGDGPVMDFVRDIVERMLPEAQLVGDGETRTALLKHYTTTRKKERMEAIPKLAATRKELRARANQFDWNEALLNCPNAVVDLRTGEQHTPEPHYYCTKQTGVRYDPTATCPRFDQFLSEVFAGDTELVEFIWHAIGYSLTGSVKEQVLFFCYGSGSNGKSTLLDVLRLVLGDYGAAAAPGLLMEARGDKHPTEIADLRGRRQVYAVETGEGKKMAEELVKRLTGGDQLKARFMRGDFFSFDPTHKLWLSANHKPVIRGNDYAIWRRIPVIPFTVSFKTAGDVEEGEPIKDTNLMDKLKMELPGILAKAVLYSIAWYDHGLIWPDVVKAEVNAYKDEMDSIGAFLEQRCQKVQGNRETAADLYREYKSWCDETGEYALTQRRLGMSLQERGYNKIKTMGNSVYVGLRLVSLAERTQV